MSLVALRSSEREVAILIHDLQMRMLWSECFKMQVLLLLRYGKANRSGDNCHWKELVILTGTRRRGHMGKHQVNQEAEEQGGNVGKSLYGSFPRKKWARQGKQAEDWLVGIISGGSGTQRLSLAVWYLVLGD